MSHEPIQMGVSHEFTTTGGKYQRHWRVWHRVWKCPTCGVLKTHLKNVMHGRRFVCNGLTQIITPKGRESLVQGEENG